MIGEEFHVLSQKGATILARMERGPVGATLLVDEGIMESFTCAQTQLRRFMLAELIGIASMTDAPARAALSISGSVRKRRGPPQILFAIRPKGRRALAAHRAAVAAWKSWKH